TARPPPQPQAQRRAALDLPVVADDSLGDAAEQHARGEPGVDGLEQLVEVVQVVRREEGEGQVGAGQGGLLAHLGGGPAGGGGGGQGGGEGHDQLPAGEVPGAPRGRSLPGVAGNALVAFRQRPKRTYSSRSKIGKAPWRRKRPL